MEKNIYDIIQDWHELLKNGTISEEEFIAKKKELLANGQSIDKTKGKEAILFTESENKNYYDYHEEIYEEESFISKYRLFIILATICLLIFGYYYYKKNKTINSNSQSTIGTYIINSDNNNLVHFYTKPNIETQRKSYFSTRDTVYVSEIQNGFGYIEFKNDRNQKSKGWIRLNDMIFIENEE